MKHPRTPTPIIPGTSCKNCKNYKPSSFSATPYDGNCGVKNKRVKSYNICEFHGKEIVR